MLAARARGAVAARAVVRHAFRNSLIPVVTIIGLQFGAVLTGTIITETIFAWPGVGRLLIQAINFRDYPLVQGCILFIAVTYVGDEPAHRPDLRVARSADSATNDDSRRPRDRARGRAGGARRPGADAVRSRGAGAVAAARGAEPARIRSASTSWAATSCRACSSGARISLLVGLAVVSVSSLVGMLLGAMAGYFGGGWTM